MTDTDLEKLTKALFSGKRPKVYLEGVGPVRVFGLEVTKEIAHTKEGVVAFRNINGIVEKEPPTSVRFSEEEKLMLEELQDLLGTKEATTARLAVKALHKWVFEGVALPRDAESIIDTLNAYQLER